MINNTNPCPNRFTMPYTVQPGDTLNSIAKRYGITLIGLIELNPTLRLRTLTEGMQLCVPKVPERPPCINGSLYTIMEGDSFYKLAQRYSVPLNSIIEANPDANPYDLKVGQEVCIPNVPSFCPFGVVHTIESGETLSNILIRYNTSINELLNTNPGFNPNILVPGTEICIPPISYQECGPDSGEYIIKANDSLATVAQAYNVTPSALLIANPNLRPANFIIIGTKICIPTE
ncbi:MAG: LysM domain-containing protein [Tissierellia bacterium]|nr:LysM domain-containing protein [Tissierellia bacterium]